MVFILIGKHFDRKFHQKVSISDVIAVIYTVLNQNRRLYVSVSFSTWGLSEAAHILKN